MKTPRRSSKVVTDTAPVTGIPVSDAKALFDAVSVRRVTAPDAISCTQMVVTPRFWAML